MDTTTIILATLGIASLVGLAWMGGYEWGCANGITAERETADRGVLDTLNTRAPSKAAKNRRKATRKARP